MKTNPTNPGEGAVEQPSFYSSVMPAQICDLCGDEFPEIDEATELCDACFEFTFGHYPEEEIVHAPEARDDR